MYNECRHIMPSGRKCHSPALSGRPYCYYHAHLHQFTSRAGRPAKLPPIPNIEDARGIQIALAEALHALSSPSIETRRIGLLLYGLQIASQLIKHTSAPRPDEIVRDLSDASGSPVDLDAPITSESGPEILAPHKTICEPPADCRHCPKQNTCRNYEEPEEEEDEEEEDGEQEEEEETDDDSGELPDEENESENETNLRNMDRDEFNRLFIRALRRRRQARASDLSTRPAPPPGAPSLPQARVGEHEPTKLHAPEGRLENSPA